MPCQPLSTLQVHAELVPSFLPRPTASSIEQPDRIRLRNPLTDWFGLQRKKAIWHQPVRVTHHATSNQTGNSLWHPAAGYGKHLASRSLKEPDSDYSGLFRTVPDYKEKKGHWAPDTPSHASRITHPLTRPERVLKPPKVCESLRKSPEAFEGPWRWTCPPVGALLDGPRRAYP